jgi:hypothetical protein
VRSRSRPNSSRLRERLKKLPNRLNPRPPNSNLRLAPRSKKLKLLLNSNSENSKLRLEKLPLKSSNRPNRLMKVYLMRLRLS